MVGMDRHEKELQNEYGVDMVWMRNGLVKWEKRVNVRKWVGGRGRKQGRNGWSDQKADWGDGQSY